MNPAPRCSHLPRCDNKTSDPSGRCHHHRVSRTEERLGTVEGAPPTATIIEDEQVYREVHPDLIRLSSATSLLLADLRAVGGRPYLVGGCVRDALIDPSSRPKDLDIEIHGMADVELVVAIASHHGRVDEVGKSFGVLKLTLDGEDLDLSLPRRDSKISEGHRGFGVKVDASLDLVTATGRRDYTINALIWDPDTHEVVDCWGGLDDIHQGVLRHVTDAFSEDPLRVLRGMQLSARLGYRMAPETVELCRRLAPAHDQLATERIWGEWDKMLTKGTHLSTALNQLRATGWLGHYPQLERLDGVPQDPAWHPEGDVWVHSGLAADKAAQLADDRGLDAEGRGVVVAAALFHDLGKVDHTQITMTESGRRIITSYGHDHGGVQPTQDLMRQIGFPRRIIDRVVPLVKEHMCAVTGEPTPTAVRRLARRLAPATMKEWALVTDADQGGRGPRGTPNTATARWLEMAEHLGVDRRPTVPVLSGRDLISRGLEPGPRFKAILAAALTAQEDGQFDDAIGGARWLDMFLGQQEPENAAL